tara:strand:- start:1426 stop:2493 length:1068 start_codon:yes stop_codon:yes gene_type:complete
MTDKNIIFVGPYSKKPKGGVAFVLYEYKKLYPNSYFVASTISKNLITKLYGSAIGIIKILLLLATQKEIEIVHIHGASYNSFTRKNIIYKISKWFKKKTIYHIHGAEYQLFYEKANNSTKHKIANFINNTDCLVCLSESWKTFFIKNFNPRRIEILPNIMATPTDLTKAKFKKTPIVFQFLGFIDERKGVWLLLETLKDHRYELQGKAIFNIGGNGETQKLKNLIKKYELEEIVNFNGWVSGKDKQQLFHDADIYLLPSYNEGLPISILEAMSYSLPILSTKVGGIPEVVSSENGILITPGSKEELWSALNYYLGLNPEQLSAMGKNSFKKVTPYLPAQVHKRLNKLYNSLLSEN